MNENISDAFKLGINIVLSSIVIWGIGVLLMNLQHVNSAIAEQQRFNQEYQEYREFSAYDNKDVRPQDIVTAVMLYKGDVGVYVKNNPAAANYEYKWDRNDVPGNKNATGYTSTSILSVLNQSSMYHATIGRGYNGEVTGLYFVKK